MPQTQTHCPAANDQLTSSSSQYERLLALLCCTFAALSAFNYYTNSNDSLTVGTKSVHIYPVWKSSLLVSSSLTSPPRGLLLHDRGSFPQNTGYRYVAEHHWLSIPAFPNQVPTQLTDRNVRSLWNVFLRPIVSCLLDMTLCTVKHQAVVRN